MKKEEIGILHAKPFWHFFVAILKVVYPKYYKHWLYTQPHTLNSLFWPQKVRFKAKITLFLSFVLINFLVRTL